MAIGYSAYGYSAYVVNGTRYPDLSSCSWADRILVSALLFEYGVPDDGTPPEVLDVSYPSDVIFPSLRDVEIDPSDVEDLFTPEERIAILDEGRPLPPPVCNRLLGHMIVNYAIDTEHTDASTRFLLQSTLSSASDVFFDRLQQAIDDDDVRLQNVRVESFYSTHILIHDAAPSRPSIDVETYPATDIESATPDASPPLSGENNGGAHAGRAHRANAAQPLGGNPAERRVRETVAREDSSAEAHIEESAADHVPAQPERDLEQLNETVDDDHDFGAGYDFRPDDPAEDGLGIDTPHEFDGHRDGEHEAASMTSSSDYVFGPLRTIEEDIGTTTYVFGPTRSLEEDLGGGVSKSWAKTLEEVAHQEDTSATYADAYDFNTQDKYDFTPPEYDTSQRNIEESDERDENVPKNEPDSWTTRPAIATEEEIDENAVGAEVVAELQTVRAHRRTTTNEPLSLETLVQLILVATILAGLALLVLLY